MEGAINRREEWWDGCGGQTVLLNPSSAPQGEEHSRLAQSGLHSLTHTDGFHCLCYSQHIQRLIYPLPQSLLSLYLPVSSLPLLSFKRFKLLVLELSFILYSLADITLALLALCALIHCPAHSLSCF